MPEIGRALDAPASQVQLTISLYLVGYAIGQIVYGPISDRYGRKPVLIAAFVIYCASTVVCFLAPSIETLIVGRIAQAMGVSGGLVVARAMVRDLHEGVHAGRQLSLMSMLMGFVPIFAPLIGGLLLTFHGWRTGFVFQFACGALAAFLVWRCIGETRKPSKVSLAAMLCSTIRHFRPTRYFWPIWRSARLPIRALFAWIAGLAVRAAESGGPVAAHLFVLLCGLVCRLHARRRCCDTYRGAAWSRSHRRPRRHMLALAGTGADRESSRSATPCL